MTTFAVFLRGVNVGGVKVLMKDLTALLSNEGYQNVRTLLASGNVLLQSARQGRGELEAHCNSLLATHYGRPIPTLVFTTDEILQLAKPFAVNLPGPAAEHHCYLTLCESQRDAQELYALAAQLTAESSIAVVGRSLCWTARKGQSTNDALGKLMAAQARRRVITTRNHNTLVKMAAIID
ncbi:DUF1697 domain-containing protein [Glutamicibacter sp. NPDC087344]|uniref:DUF1697 domain-containing protein n=1 Tax=Glutamicibacter sp. NPDC087344 TaxID=3363994 RepID=UPI00382E6A94